MAKMGRIVARQDASRLRYLITQSDSQSLPPAGFGNYYAGTDRRTAVIP